MNLLRNPQVFLNKDLHPEMYWLMPYRHKYMYSTSTIFLLDILRWNIIALISDVLQVACDTMPLNDNERFIPYLYPLILG